MAQKTIQFVFKTIEARPSKQVYRSRSLKLITLQNITNCTKAIFIDKLINTDSKLHACLTCVSNAFHIGI